jgi:hypothetical protein
MKPSSAKAKGRRLQQHVRDRIRATFPSLHPDDVQSRSSGSNGEDVMLSPAARDLVPFSIECGNQERVNIWKKWAQCCSNAGDHAPLVVISRNNGTALAVLELDVLLGLLQYRPQAIERATGKVMAPAFTYDQVSLP